MGCLVGEGRSWGTRRGVKDREGAAGEAETPNWVVFS